VHAIVSAIQNIHMHAMSSAYLYNHTEFMQLTERGTIRLLYSYLHAWRPYSKIHLPPDIITQSFHSTIGNPL